MYVMLQQVDQTFNMQASHASYQPRRKNLSLSTRSIRNNETVSAVNQHAIQRQNISPRPALATIRQQGRETQCGAGGGQHPACPAAPLPPMHDHGPQAVSGEAFVACATPRIGLVNEPACAHVDGQGGSVGLGELRTGREDVDSAKMPVGARVEQENAPPTASMVRTVAPRMVLPASYAPVLQVPKSVRELLRLRVASDHHGVRRGVLSAGWRPMLKIKKLRRVYMKTELHVSTCRDAATKLSVKRTGLCKAAEVVPNLRSLEALLFTTFVEFEVKKAVWPVMETKTYQTSVRALEDHGGRGIAQAGTSRFQIMVCGNNHVVCDCSKPVVFASWEEMLAKAGGLHNIVHEPTLRAEMRLTAAAPIIGQTLAEYCKSRGAPAYPVTGFCGFRLRKRLFPWVTQDLSDEAVERNFARLRACMAALQNVWSRVGLWEEVLAPLPPGWQGGQPDTRAAF
jgi:hypothetical protein